MRNSINNDNTKLSIPIYFASNKTHQNLTGYCIKSPCNCFTLVISALKEDRKTQIYELIYRESREKCMKWKI